MVEYTFGKNKQPTLIKMNKILPYSFLAQLYDEKQLQVIHNV